MATKRSYAIGVVCFLRSGPQDPYTASYFANAMCGVDDALAGCHARPDVAEPVVEDVRDRRRRHAREGCQVFQGDLAALSNHQFLA